MASKSYYGVIISILIHLIIISIPISKMAVKNFEGSGVEFFIIDEGIAPSEQKKVIAPIKLQRNPIETTQTIEKVKQVDLSANVLDSEELEPEVIEQTLNKASVEEVQLETPSEPINNDSSFQTRSDDKPVDTEFGLSDGPKFLHQKIPEYPFIAKRLGTEGRVVLRLTIDEKGQLLNIEVIKKAGYGFTEAAVKAVKKSTFLPAIKNGRPIASRAILPVKFILQGDS
ncbi:MAG: TonB family protein [Nitrospirota bacterium]